MAAKEANIPCRYLLYCTKHLWTKISQRVVGLHRGTFEHARNDIKNSKQLLKNRENKLKGKGMELEFSKRG